MTYIDRSTSEEHHIELAGVFRSNWTCSNTDWLGDSVERNKFGEIVTDKRGATNVPGVFAAGDCSDSAYKQIIISMGAGANCFIKCL